MATKSQFRKTETAHQNEIFKMKGREPTKYGADINDSDKHESSIGSSTTHGYLFTHHDHKTGAITHQWDRSKVKPHLKEGEMDEEIDEALVSKATLARYRAKSKTKFKENGGISAALDKQDKAKSLSKSLDRGLAMRMAGDGGHVPNFREEVEVDKKDDKKKKPKLKTFPMPSRPHRESPNDGPQPKKEDLDIVDVVMTQEEPDASPYIAEIETRCDTLVAEIKDGLKKSLFDFSEGHSIGQLKQAADAHRMYKGIHQKTLGNPAKHTGSQMERAGKQYLKHEKARDTADKLRWKMDKAGVSHSSKLPKETDDQRRGGLALKKLAQKRKDAGI